MRRQTAHERALAGTFDYGAAWSHVPASAFDDDPDAFGITDTSGDEPTA